MVETYGQHLRLQKADELKPCPECKMANGHKPGCQEALAYLQRFTRAADLRGDGGFYGKLAAKACAERDHVKKILRECLSALDDAHEVCENENYTVQDKIICAAITKAKNTLNGDVPNKQRDELLKEAVRIVNGLRGGIHIPSAMNAFLERARAAGIVS